MMGGATVAACLMIVSTDIQPVHVALTAIGAGDVGGLIPDIDHPGSKISSILRPVNALVSVFFSHRGLFHAPILYLLPGALWAWKYPDSEYSMWIYSFLSGALSHLFLNSLNLGGIPLFFPVTSKHFHFARIRAGGRGEAAVRGVLGALMAAAAFMFLKQILSDTRFDSFRLFCIR